jgi:hypothetical protein
MTSPKTAVPAAQSVQKPTFGQTLQKLRNTKSFRIGFLAVLFLILLAMYFIGGKMKGLLLVLMVVVLGAIGLQATDYDLDLETLWKSGNIQESRVEAKNGVKIIGTACQSNNLNCADFATQGDAQAKYETCGDKIAKDNKQDRAAIRSLDIYGLDKDKDGTVCESLKRGVSPAVAQ